MKAQSSGSFTSIPARLPTVLLLSLVWAIIQPFITSSVYWRDSGEFILAAYFLDIVHPPGYPLYGMLSNFWALLPLGPIAWRVGLFSILTATLFLILLYRISTLILRDEFNLEGGLLALLSTIAPLTVGTSSPFLRQALSAEGYILNGVLVEVLLLIYLRFCKVQDLRWLLLAAFVGGLGLGNHISLALIFLFCSVVVLVQARRADILWPTILLGALGLMIYGYIPVRASAYPPLNSGGAISASRFFDFVSDRRDFVLRSAVNGGDVAGNTQVARQAVGTLGRNLAEFSWPVVGMSLLGVVALIGANTPLGLIVLACAVLNWWFFMNWDPDPWIPVFMVIGLGVAVFLANIHTMLQRVLAGRGSSSPSVALIVPCFAIGVLLLRLTQLPITEVLSLSRDQLPASIGRRLLDPLPQGAVFVTQESWFLTKYLRDIEGYRQDVVLQYQPNLLFPMYFAPVALKALNDQIFTTLDPASGQCIDEGLTTFSRFVALVSRSAPLFIEPSLALNEKLREVLRLDNEGRVSLVFGMAHELQPGFMARRVQEIVELREAIARLPAELRGDAQNYLETIATNTADLLKHQGQVDLAAELLERTCEPLDDTVCSAIPLNNLGVYLTDLGQVQRAIQLYERLLGRTYTSRETLLLNLARAKRLQSKDK